MPSITFQPVLRDVKDVMKSDYYEIPRFQRPYSWGPEHLDEFWTDVANDNEEGYFIGPMVAYKLKRDTFAIVDGQQRITTLTLILCALRDCFIEVGRRDLAEGLTKYIERTDDDNVAHFVLRSEPAGSFLASQVQRQPPRVEAAATNEDQRSLRRAFLEIQSRLRSGVPSDIPEDGLGDVDDYLGMLRRIRDRILTLQLIWIVLDTEDDAYVIFETLNSRGRDLEVVDLLKNYVLNRLPAENADLDTPGIAWRQMRETLAVQGGDVNPNMFLLHWWISQYKYVSERKLFRTMKLEKLGGLGAQDAVDSLLRDSQLYAKIANPDQWKCLQSERAVRDSLAALNIFSVRQPRPLILALMRSYASRVITFKRLRLALEAIESFHFITTAVVGASSTGGTSMMYAAHAREVSNAKSVSQVYASLDELITKLRASVSLRETFITEFVGAVAFTEARSKDKRLVQYILQRMHNELQSAFPLDPGKCNIEHLAPQSDDGDWVGSIGNLIWIEEKLNGQMGKKSFADKKVLLLPYVDVYGLADVLAESEWGEAQVKARARVLAEVAYDRVWKF
jgi:uncharacterized protein DUF262/uncharacterized protein DUF1524